jgi:hypothetical protein
MPADIYAAVPSSPSRIAGHARSTVCFNAKSVFRDLRLSDFGHLRHRSDPPLFEHDRLALPDKQRDTALFAEDFMLGAGRVERDVARLEQALRVGLAAADDDRPLPTSVAMARRPRAWSIAQNRRRRPAVGIAMQPRRLDSLAERLETQR